MPTGEAMPPALFDVADPTDADDAARLLTDRYATGIDRQLWEDEGVPLTAEAAVRAVLADPSPAADALVAVVALIPRGRDMWDLYEQMAMTLARSLEQPVSWETLGRALGASKQAAQQRYERRQRDAERLHAYRPDLHRPRPTTAQRVWLDEHAAELRHVVTLMHFDRPELLAVDPSVARALHDLDDVHYLQGDAEVLAAARRLVATLRQVEQERAELPPWDRVRLPEQARQVINRLAALLANAP